MWPVNVVTQTTTTSPWCACRNCLKRRADSTSLPSLATSLVNKNQMCVSFSQVLNIVWLYSLQAYDQCYCRCYPYSFSSLALLAACFTGWNYLSLIILIVVWLTSFGICFVAVIVKCDSVFLCFIPQCLCDTHNYYVVAMKWQESFTFDILCKIWSAAQSSWPLLQKNGLLLDLDL